MLAGVYDEKVLVGLDYAINEASKRGIRVVLVFANYWAMYGGIDQYNIWSFEAGSGACSLHGSATLSPEARLLLLVCLDAFAHVAMSGDIASPVLAARKWRIALQALINGHACACSGNCNGDATCRDDFYSDPVAVGYYKDHVKKLLNRVNVFNGRLYRSCCCCSVKMSHWPAPAYLHW